MTGSEIGDFETSLVAFAVEGGAGACWVPALAGARGAGVVGATSALAICAADSATGFGTGYSLGTDPRLAYV